LGKAVKLITKTEFEIPQLFTNFPFITRNNQRGGLNVKTCLSAGLGGRKVVV
jgi:hypothetical protein